MPHPAAAFHSEEQDIFDTLGIELSVYDHPVIKFLRQEDTKSRLSSAAFRAKISTWSEGVMNSNFVSPPPGLADFSFPPNCEHSEAASDIHDPMIDTILNYHVDRALQVDVLDGSPRSPNLLSLEEVQRGQVSQNVVYFSS